MRASLVVGLLAVMAAGCSSAGTDVESSSTTVPDAITTTTTTTPLSTTTIPATTTVPPEPPELVVIIPTDGETVTTRLYRFAGMTDPGCSVAVAGRYFADVASDGSWTLELLLNPGTNTTTITATDPETAMATSREVRVHYEPPLTLRPDGIGELDFGTLEDEAVSYLVDVLGPPESDQSSTPPCYERVLTWTSAGLEIAISQDGGWSPGGSSFACSRPPSLTGWQIEETTHGPRLDTPDSIGLGDPASAACTTYADDCEGEYLNVEFSGEYWDHSIPHLWIGFDGPGTEPSTKVVEMGASYTGGHVEDHEAAIERLHYRARLLGTWRGTITTPWTPHTTSNFASRRTATQPPISKMSPHLPSISAHTSRAMTRIDPAAHGT